MDPRGLFEVGIGGEANSCYTRRNQVTFRPLTPRPTHHALTLQSDPCFLKRTTLDYNPFLLGQGRILEEGSAVRVDKIIWMSLGECGNEFINQWTVVLEVVVCIIKYGYQRRKYVPLSMKESELGTIWLVSKYILGDD